MVILTLKYLNKASSNSFQTYHLRLNKANTYTWSHLRHMPVPPPLGLLFNLFNCIFCPMQLQMVIFDFKEEGTGIEHVAIATLKCLPTGIFLRVQMDRL